MSNFDFLKPYSRKLARAGFEAESIVYKAPSACAGQLRYIAEELAKETAIKRKLTPQLDEYGKHKFDFDLQAIKVAGLAPRKIIEEFYDIKKCGNDGVHELSVLAEDAVELLKATYDVSVWFARNIVFQKEFIPSFVPPHPPSKATTSTSQSANVDEVPSDAASGPNEHEASFPRDGTGKPSNFDFLKPYNPNWARAGAEAEALYVNSFPGPCAVKLRSLAENIADDTVSKLGLPDLRPKWKRGAMSFHDQVEAISQALPNNRNIPVALDSIRQIGNFEAHNNFGGCVRASAEALAKTHEVAVWFMKTVVRSANPIPDFIPPTVRSGGDVPAWKKVLSIKQGKMAVAVVAVLAAIFGYYSGIDKNHDLGRALRNTVRFVVFLLILVLLALPLFVLANGLSVWGAYHLFVSSIAEKLVWNEYLIHSLGLVLLLPFCYSVRLAFSRKSSRRVAGFAVLILMAVGYNLTFYYAIKGTPFLIGSGNGAKWYELTDEGCKFYDRPGFSPSTGKPLLPVTPDLWRDCQIEASAPTVAVDAASNPWFNPTSGAPMLWYSSDSSGNLVFYRRPGVDPNAGVKLLPVTQELHVRWLALRQPRPVTSETPKDPLTVILHPSAGDGPGVLLLGQTPDSKGGAEAIERHLSGVNTSAFSSSELESRGYAAKFFRGDSGLVRGALSITHLNSLLVGEVETDCTKRSSLDPDMLSCDLTAKMRKFDVNGNLSGSQMVQATGAGFNLNAALDMAAQRASRQLIAFAK